MAEGVLSRIAGFFRPPVELGPFTKSEKDQRALDKRQCPDCGSSVLIGGPRGGAAQNIACGECFSEFNVVNFDGKLGLIDRMGKLSPKRAELYGLTGETIREKLMPIWSEAKRTGSKISR
jgi:ribosomal protein S27AE